MKDEFYGWSAEKYHRKADQHWEMAGLARQDNDPVDAAKHTELARQYEQKARELWSCTRT